MNTWYCSWFPIGSRIIDRKYSESLNFRAVTHHVLCCKSEGFKCPTYGDLNVLNKSTKKPKQATNSRRKVFLTSGKERDLK